MRFAAAAAVLLVFPSGPKCTGSVRPIYTERDAVVEDALVGTWRVVVTPPDDSASDAAARPDNSAAMRSDAADTTGSKPPPDRVHQIVIARLTDPAYPVASYLVSSSDSGVTGRGLGRLTRIGKTLFADLYPYDLQTLDMFESKVEYHTWVRIERRGESYVVIGIDPSWLARYVREHPTEISASAQEDNMILRDSTSRVRALLLTSMSSPGAYTDSILLARVPATVVR